MVGVLARGLLFRFSSWSKRPKTPQVLDRIQLFVIGSLVFAARKSVA